MKLLYHMRLIQGEKIIELDFGDNQGSRGACLAGFQRVGDQVKVEAYDVDEQGRVWTKEV